MKILLDIKPAKDNYCGDGNGNFCPFMLKRKFGTIPFCSVFDKDLPITNRKITRLEECVCSTASGLL